MQQKRNLQTSIRALWQYSGRINDTIFHTEFRGARKPIWLWSVLWSNQPADLWWLSRLETVSVPSLRPERGWCDLWDRPDSIWWGKWRFVGFVVIVVVKTEIGQDLSQRKKILKNSWKMEQIARSLISSKTITETVERPTV